MHPFFVHPINIIVKKTLKFIKNLYLRDGISKNAYTTNLT